MQIVEEATGLICWKLVLAREGEVTKVSIKGPRNGEKAWVRISTKDLLQAVLEETKGGLG